jgi:nicotinate-nucleotide adenylyltransferase
MEQLQYDQVWLVPSGVPPHRKAYSIAPEHRLAMTELAASLHPRIEVCQHEVFSRSVNYSLDTVRSLQAQHPEHQFALLSGIDAIYDHEWYGQDQLLQQLTHFAVADRPGYRFQSLLEKMSNRPGADKFVRVALPLHEVSSSLIRERLSKGQSVHFWLPEEVRVYLEQHGLYASTGATSGSV